MEQYYMPKDLDFDNLSFCLNHYLAKHLFIRNVGSSGGTTQISESIKNRCLDFKIGAGMDIILDGKDIFHFDSLDGFHTP